MTYLIYLLLGVFAGTLSGLFGIGGFSLSFLGNFLVRSGVIVSVHSFASDPNRGLFILGSPSSTGSKSNCLALKMLLFGKIYPLS